MLASHKGKDSTRGSNNDCGCFLLELLNVGGDGLATIYDIDRHFIFVHVLSKPIILLFDLEGQFTGVAHNKH